jgi:catechol 2,3-dioxygenase-like lactoylglutathione lyase family enzyme
MKIEHLAFMVAEPKKMANWYGEHLGLKVLRSFEGKAEPHFLVDDAGCVVLEIYNNHDFKVPNYAEMPPAVLHVAFLSDDLPADFERLVKAGATIVDEPAKTELGDQFAMLRDPWGLAVQLVTRAKPLQ